MCRYVASAGEPIVFAEEKAVTDADLGQIYNGKSLREFMWTKSLKAFVQSTEGPLRRMILVCSVETIHPTLHLAAAVVGARLQQNFCVPMLRFEPVSGLVVAFTETFRTRQKAFVGIVAAAANRTRSSSRDAAIRLLSLKGFKAEFQNQAYRSKRWMKTWSIVYEDSEFDALVKTIPPEEREVTRSLPEFLQHCCPLAKRILR